MRLLRSARHRTNLPPRMEFMVRIKCYEYRNRIQPRRETVPLGTGVHEDVVTRPEPVVAEEYFGKGRSVSEDWRDQRPGAICRLYWTFSLRYTQTEF